MLTQGIKTKVVKREDEQIEAFYFPIQANPTKRKRHASLNSPFDALHN